MKKGAAKFQKDYNLVFEGMRWSSQLRGRPGTVFLVWFSGAGEGGGGEGECGIVGVCFDLSNGSLMDQFMALTFFYRSQNFLRGGVASWPAVVKSV